MRAHGLFLSILAAGCSASVPPTEVLVRVHADPFVTAHATNLHVAIHGGTADTTGPNVVDADYPKTPTGTGLMGFPQSFGVSPTGGDVTRYFDVVARGDLDDGRVVVQHYAGAYLPHRVVVLDMWLRETCIGVACVTDMTCDDGVCTAVHIAPGMLHELDGGAEEAGPSDGGVVDADAVAIDQGPPDANVDAGCTSGAQCDDHVFCNGVERCVAGDCQPASTTPSCDDDVACTRDVCDTTADACNHTGDDAMCTLASGGHCDVVNGCQYPVCDGTTCMPTPMNCETVHCVGTTCVRDTTCTSSQMCCHGVCEVAGCEDGNGCTNDSCNEASGCMHVNNVALCSDGDACTLMDRCGGGSCQAGTTLAPCVPDANPCTDDYCDAIAGCIHPDNVAPCSDGNACTTGDRCNMGSCAGTSSVSCDDGVACTDDTCAMVGGCAHAANDLNCGAAAGGHCDSLAGCQYPSCNSSTCADDTANCISATCSGASTCTRTSRCTGSQMCCAGTCVALNCDDGNSCTDDACGAAGCTNVGNGHPCDDGNACTVGELCDPTGACRGGTSRSCDDGNPCTNDSCVPATGCSNVPSSGSCSDGNMCTTGDFCSGGVCNSGGPLTCDDDNACTSNFCSSSSGCYYTAISCDDGLVCTTDTCDMTAGCQHTTVTACMDAGAAFCGMRGQPCCGGSSCNSPLICNGGTVCCLRLDGGAISC